MPDNLEINHNKMNLNTLQGKFHAHITVNSENENIACPKGWKITIILLKSEKRIQNDVMITRHFYIGRGKISSINGIMSEIKSASAFLHKNGSHVTREKLEHESLPTLSPSTGTYRECHIKIKHPISLVLHTIDGFVESNNPMEIADNYKTVFLNARFYKNSVFEIDRFIDESVNRIKILNPESNILEVKKETTVYDSNLELDRWWA